MTIAVYLGRKATKQAKTKTNKQTKGPRREKTCLRWVADSLISAFVIRLLESIISRLATSEISYF